MEALSTNVRSAEPVIIQDLFDNPYEYSFYQAVRLLRALSKDKPSIGATEDPADESLLVKSNLSYSLQNCDVSHVGYDGDRASITVNFLNISGPHGPLPSPMSEVMYDRQRLKDFAMKDFLDIFSHRMASLFYRVAEKHSFVLCPKQPSDQVSGEMLTAFLGLSNADISKTKLSKLSLLRYAGIFWQKPHSAAGLEQILRDYFKVKVNIRQFEGGWISMQKSQRTNIGIAKGKNNTLGDNAFLGKHYWNQAQNFVVHLEGLSAEEFLELIPTGTGYKVLCEIIKLYAGAEFSYQVKLHLKEKEALPELLIKNNVVQAPRLGWTCFMKTSPENYSVNLTTL